MYPAKDEPFEAMMSQVIDCIILAKINKNIFDALKNNTRTYAYENW